MVYCTACLRRSLNAAAVDGIHKSTSQSIPHIQIGRRRRTSIGVYGSYANVRGHATYESLTRGHHKRLLRVAITEKLARTSRDGKSNLPLPNARRKGAGAMTKGEIKDAIARQRNRENNLIIKDDAADGKIQLKLKKEVENWHRDPVQLANQVQKKLRIPDFANALNLVRASEGVVANNVVSWNHLIDFCMSQGDAEKAWKVYNEMKKRGHRPDAYTYTIMLRGLSTNARKKTSAERAVGIYNSMFAPNSNVTPNTIHTNAALNVCARTGDMDSLWAIAGRLPTSGPGAPDRWTFTTILNAIRDDATTKVADLLSNPDRGLVDGMTLTQRQELIFDEALKDARKLWADINYRWRRADLVIDETLVCAMGRLIIGCGSKQDYGEVFDLVEQTMNIRLKEKQSTPHLIPESGTQISQDTTELALQPQELADQEESSSSQLPLDESVIYAQPSNNTLGMIMEAALGSRQLQYAKSYWHILTTPNGPFKLKPDAANIISYLRVLRVSRASKAALDLLSQTWPLPIAEKLYRRGTFVIAMSACIRDKNNPSVFDTADKLLLLMQERLEEQSLRMYSQNETNSDLSFKERKQKKMEEIANLDDVTFGEEEAHDELARQKQNVESLSVDPKALRMYVDLSVLTTNGWNEGLLMSSQFFPNRQDDDDNQKFERDSKKNHALKALKRIGPQLILIRRLAKMKIEELELESMSRSRIANYNGRGGQNIKRKPQTNVAENLEDLIDLLRSIVGAYDKVIMMADRFEDQDLPRLEEDMIKRFRESKRAVSGFLFRTKVEVARVKAKKYDFAQFRSRSTTENEDEDEYEDMDGDESGNTNSTSNNHLNHFNPQKTKPTSQKPRLRPLTLTLQKVHLDTDRSLNRTRSLSRRQRNERKKELTIRMRRRDLLPRDIGVVGEDLEIEDKKIVEERMRNRAFGIQC